MTISRVRGKVETGDVSRRCGPLLDARGEVRKGTGLEEGEGEGVGLGWSGSPRNEDEEGSMVTEGVE